MFWINRDHPGGRSLALRAGLPALFLLGLLVTAASSPVRDPAMDDNSGDSIRPTNPKPAHAPWEHRRYTDSAPYFIFRGHRYPLVQRGAPAVVPVVNSDYSGDGLTSDYPVSSAPSQETTATDQSDQSDQNNQSRVWVEGHYEDVARAEPIDDQTVEVYHPAVYRQREDGTLDLVEAERTTREPKVRIVLTRQYIEGHYEYPGANEPPTPGGMQSQPGQGGAPTPSATPSAPRE